MTTFIVIDNHDIALDGIANNPDVKDAGGPVPDTASRPNASTLAGSDASRDVPPIVPNRRAGSPIALDPVVIDPNLDASIPTREPLVLVGRFHDMSQIDLSTAPPDVAVLDLYLGRDDTPSIDFIPPLVIWGARVLMHTSAEFPVPLRQTIAAGANGLSLKNDGVPALLAAVRAVAAGDFACSSTVAYALLTDPKLSAHLTPRELEVVQSLSDGLSHREVARRFGIAEATIKNHLKSVRAKYACLGRDISNAHSIVREARRDGWLRDP